MKKIPFSVWMIALIAALLAVVPALAGGWAVVTLTYLPGQITAGTPFMIEFAVRNHGQVLGAGHTPTVYFYQGESLAPLRFDAPQTDRNGHYAARVTLPESRTWEWSISSYDAPGAAQTMPALDVLPAVPTGQSGTAALTRPLALPVAAVGVLVLAFSAFIFTKERNKAALGMALAGALALLLTIPLLMGNARPAEAAESNALASYDGQQLFMAKGCVVCHQHARGRLGYEGLQSNIGPNLTEIKLPAEYLRIWLANPPGVKPKTAMPNLNLSSEEIEALVTFLTAP